MKHALGFLGRGAPALALGFALGACNGPGERVAVDPQAQECVALAMYWEARGEGRDGMLAVGSVVLNRVADERFPNDTCTVIREGGERPPCQFSWWCDGRSDRPTQAKLWQQSLEVARELLAEPPRDPTNGALYFHRASMEPPWDKQRTARIGDHVFYR